MTWDSTGALLPFSYNANEPAPLSPCHSVLRRLRHPNNRQRFAVRQRNLEMLQLHIAARPIHRHSSQRCPHLETRKSRGPRGGFTSLQNPAADAAPRPCGMDKKRANFRRITRRIQKVVFSSCPSVAAIERLAFAPPTTSDDDAFAFCSLRLRFAGFGFSHEICPVSNQLAVHPVDRLQRALQLLRRVVLRLQSPHRRFNQLAQNGNICGNGLANADVGLHKSFKMLHPISRMSLPNRCTLTISLISPKNWMRHFRRCAGFAIFCIFLFRAAAGRELGRKNLSLTQDSRKVYVLDRVRV